MHCSHLFHLLSASQGSQPPVAVVQVSVPIINKTYVISLSNIVGRSARTAAARFPAGLKAFLESKEHLKVGVNIAGDSAKLKRDFKVDMGNSTLDIVALAKGKGLFPRKKASLQQMSCLFLKADLPKGKCNVIIALCKSALMDITM